MTFLLCISKKGRKINLMGPLAVLTILLPREDGEGNAECGTRTELRHLSIRCSAPTQDLSSGGLKTHSEGMS